MKLKYMCLDSALDLWTRGHFELGFFSLLGSGVRKWIIQPSPPLKGSKTGNGCSPKWVLFNIVSGQITSDARWK